MIENNAADSTININRSNGNAMPKERQQSEGRYAGTCVHGMVFSALCL